MAVGEGRSLLVSPGRKRGTGHPKREAPARPGTQAPDTQSCDSWQDVGKPTGTYFNTTAASATSFDTAAPGEGRGPLVRLPGPTQMRPSSSGAHRQAGSFRRCRGRSRGPGPPQATAGLLCPKPPVALSWPSAQRTHQGPSSGRSRSRKREHPGATPHQPREAQPSQGRFSPARPGLTVSTRVQPSPGPARGLQPLAEF